MKKIAVGLLILLPGLWVTGLSSAFGQDDAGKMIEQKRLELTEKEKRLRNEEERIKNIEKEVEGKIQKLNQLLIQIEAALKRLAEVRSEKLDHLVKTFEAMPAEEAAIRLSALDKSLTVQIIFRMTSKKAGPILALMEPKKVSEISEIFSKTEKKIPTK